MLVAEHIDDEGELRQTTLELCADGAMLRTGELIEVVPLRAILLTMRRFGRALDPQFTPDGAALDLGSGLSLRMLRFRAQVDAEPKRYLVLEGDGEPLAALSTEIAAALRFLAREVKT